jgi:hypothetical protein
LKVEWNLDPTKGYQFRTELSFKKGKGNRLGPMAYCVAGITSCFIASVRFSVFVILASIGIFILAVMSYLYHDMIIPTLQVY